jgi:hypothetical protein
MSEQAEYNGWRRDPRSHFWVKEIAYPYDIQPGKFGGFKLLYLVFGGQGSRVDELGEFATFDEAVAEYDRRRSDSL